MSRARKSKLPAPPPSKTQLAKWRKFVGTAAQQAHSPLAAVGLSGLAHSLAKTPLPLDQRSTAAPLYQLLQLAKPFESFMAERRMREAAALLRLSEACTLAIGSTVTVRLSAEDLEGERRRFRADIDG